ncbi:MAG: GNAT family N-acetyltransferase [Ruminococcus flavefaciens]|nr:GNAT family N-acetyltransferase [Ruminococcus flavefaciens]
MADIEIVLGYKHTKEISNLFSEYTNMLITNDSSFQDYLDIQHYDKEINHLEEKYGMPYGRLYLAYCDGEAAGCIGLKKIDELNCEMKRLYVRPQFRGKNIGGLLVQKVILDAKQIGYSYMLLDTLPFLGQAIHLYEKFGFYTIDCYNNSPMSTSIYMKLDL